MGRAGGLYTHRPMNQTRAGLHDLHQNICVQVQGNDLDHRYKGERGIVPLAIPKWGLRRGRIS